MKKKVLTIITMLVLCVCFLFSGCTKLSLPTGKVSSNGGSVVVVGDYIYYANTFVDVSTLSKNDNTTKTTKHNSMYRVKTVDDGVVKYDEDDNLTDVEKVYEKIAGFATSNMFIVGDYLYFTSPNVHKEDKTGADKFDLTTLFRMKLNGTDFKEILTTRTTSGTFCLVNGSTPYLLIYDNNQISKLVLENKISSAKVLVDKASGVALPKQTDSLRYVYYTTDIDENETNAGIKGNYLNRLDLNDNSTTCIESKPVANTISLVAYEDNILYYKKLVDGTSLYYSNTMVGGFEAGEKVRTVFGDVDGTDEISSFTTINKDNVVYIYNSKIYLNHINDDGTTKYELLISEKATIEYVSGDYIYYSLDSGAGVYRISYKDKVSQKMSEKTDIKTGSFDFDGTYIYFYAKSENNTTETYYLYRANTKTAENGRINTERLGQILSDDAKPQE